MRCNPAGTGSLTTLIECRVFVAATLEFGYASTEILRLPQKRLQEIVNELTRRLKVPERTVVVFGHADEAEARTKAARERLALGRARVVREKLVQAGLPADRMAAKVADAHSPRPTSAPSHQRIVSFGLDPDHPTRGDQDPPMQPAVKWCGEE